MKPLKPVPNPPAPTPRKGADPREPELIRPFEGPNGTPAEENDRVIRPPETGNPPYPGVHVT